jgi:putative ABC transport system substrate-binding protein
VIAAAGGPTSGQAAKAATATIPIVFISGADPVQEGLVASLNRPGGNATGVSPLLPAMEGKRLGLLREVIPKAAMIGVLLNPAVVSNFDRQVTDIEEAARAVGQQPSHAFVSPQAKLLFPVTDNEVMRARWGRRGM